MDADVPDEGVSPSNTCVLPLGLPISDFCGKFIADINNCHYNCQKTVGVAWATSVFASSAMIVLTRNLRRDTNIQNRFIEINAKGRAGDRAWSRRSQHVTQI